MLRRGEPIGLIRFGSRVDVVLPVGLRAAVRRPAHARRRDRPGEARTHRERLVTRRPGVADVLTLGNALCGVAAIFVVVGSSRSSRLTMSGRYQAAAMLLLFGTLFDVLDGAAARRWGGTALGGPLDSLADAITSASRPSWPSWRLRTVGRLDDRVALVVAGGLVYVAAALVRLATSWPKA